MASSHERRKADREVVRILSKLGIHKNDFPSEQMPAKDSEKFKWRWNYTLTITLTIVSLMFLVFPPQEPITLFGYLVVMFALGIYPLLHVMSLLFGPRWIGYVSEIVLWGAVIAYIGYKRFPPPNSEVHVSEDGKLFIENKNAKLNIQFVSTHSSELLVRRISLILVADHISTEADLAKAEQTGWQQLRDRFEQVRAVSKSYSFKIEPYTPLWFTIEPEQPNLTDSQIKSLQDKDGKTTVFFLNIANYGDDLGEIETCVLSHGEGGVTVNCGIGHNGPVRPMRRHWWNL